MPPDIFNVKSILCERLVPSRRYLVLWEAGDETWEPADNLRGNRAFMAWQGGGAARMLCRRVRINCASLYEGTAVEYDARSGKYAVSLDGGGKLAHVKSGGLEEVAPAAPSAATPSDHCEEEEPPTHQRRRHAMPLSATHRRRTRAPRRHRHGALRRNLRRRRHSRGRRGRRGSHSKTASAVAASPASRLGLRAAVPRASSSSTCRTRRMRRRRSSAPTLD